MANTTSIEAFGFDWGTWTRNCSKGTSRVTPSRGVYEKFDFDTQGLLQKIDNVLDFIPVDSLKKLNKTIKKWLPKGRFSLELALAIAAGQSKCTGKPAVRVVYAGLTLALRANIEIIVQGKKSFAKLVLLEHLTLEKEFCLCPPNTTKTQKIGLDTSRAEKLIALTSFTEHSSKDNLVEEEISFITEAQASEKILSAPVGNLNVEFDKEYYYGFRRERNHGAWPGLGNMAFRL